MKKTVRLLVVLIGSISTNSAMAESGKWYIGAGAGQSSYSDWTSANIAELRDEFGSRLGIVRIEGTQSAGADDSATGYKLFGGYSLYDNIAVEFSYIDMGEVDANSEMSGTFYDLMNNSLDGDLFATARAEVSAFTLDARLNVPIASYAAVVLKGGIYAANTKLRLNATSSISAENFSYSKTDRSTGLHYGLGINLKVTDAIGLRAELERLDNVEANHGESDVDLISAALIYNF